MKRNKKLIAMILATVQILLIATSCGNTGASASEAAPSAASEAAVQSAVDETTPEASAPDAAAEAADTETAYFPLAERKTVSLWCTVGMALKEINKGFADTYGNQWLQDQLNVEIEFHESQQENATTDVNLMLAGGDYTDIIGGLNAYYNGGLSAAYEEGIILRLNDIVDDYMPNYKNMLSEYEDARKMSLNDDGDMLSVVGTNEFGFPATFGPIIRQDWLDELNMDAPETYDDYYNFLTAIKNQYGCSAPLIFNCYSDGNNQNGTIDWNQLSAGYGVAYTVNLRRGLTPFYAIDGERVTYGPLEPGYLDFITMMNKWYSEGLFNKDFMSQDQEKATELVTNNQTGIWYWYSSRVEYYNDMATDPDFNAYPIQDAVLERGQVNHLGSAPASLSDANGSVITANVEDVELVARFLDWGFSDEGYMCLNYGIEGYTYNLDDNGDPVYTDIMLNNEEGMTIDQAQTWYQPGCGYLPGVSDWKNKLPGYTQKQIDASDIWGVHDNSWMITQASMTPDESKEYAALYADIATHYQESFLAFLTGDRPLSEFDVFVDELKQMGIDRCIELWQAAWDRYEER